MVLTKVGHFENTNQTKNNETLISLNAVLWKMLAVPDVQEKQLLNLVFAPTVLKGSTRVARVDTSVMKLCGRQRIISIT